MQKSQVGESSRTSQAAEHRLYTYTVGICATGSPPTLEPLLETVLSSEMPGFLLKKVVLVASDCSEDTLRVARRMAALDRRLRLIEHERRTGKADAINEIFRLTEGDFLVYVNADALIEVDSISILLRSIEEDEGIGFVSGKPVFVRSGSLISDILDVMWTSFDLLSSDPDQSKQSNHGTDELMVIRSDLLSELPPGVVNDGAYIAGRIREMGLRVAFQPDAIVQIDVPRRIIDLIRQRRRILFGHIQVKRLLGKAPRTVETMMFFSPYQSVRIIIRMLANRPRRILILPVAAMGELLAVSGALWDTFVSNAGHAVWKRYEQGPPTANIKATIAVVATNEANESFYQRLGDFRMSLTLTEKQAREIEAFCQIAGENGAAISLRELIGLAAIEASEHELETAFRSDSKLGSKFLLESGYVLDRHAVSDGSSRQTVEEEDRRRERARSNLKIARRFGTALTRGAVLVSVSGANSFLSASKEDDIDFFCVTKTNGMWPFMLRALILARIHRLANKDTAELCFSCVMDERWATQTFRKRQHPIFARDALTAKVIGGRPTYHALLEEARWIKDYFPAFYGMRLRETNPQEGEPTRNGAVGTEGSFVLNSYLYHTLGAFLRMKSWTLNRKLAKAGRHSAAFSTRIGEGNYIYESNRYRKLRKMYDGVEKDLTEHSGENDA